MIEFEINTYQPLLENSYIHILKMIADKKVVIKVQNTDQTCFMWSILSALYPCHNSNRVIYYNEFKKG